ncbi:MAG TPA: CDP-alcohol phosphatidyltransferase family protein [Ktedonobacterales bacterium]|nr:CDP-alcohol phosphatidyltransferase family protein [Ktedonobacterales bacterium]
MFGPRIQQYARHIAELVVSPLVAIGLTPNMATLLGLLLNCATAAVIATGNLRIGGVMLLFAGLFDMVDGALARKRNMRTTFGAFFDSTLDRFSEGIVLLGIIVYAMQQPPDPSRTWLVALTYVAGLSSLMVSYARARAEGLGLEVKTGLMARPERVLLLVVGLILGGAAWLLWVIGILAVTSTYTSVQRIVVVWRTIRREQVAPAAPPNVRRERSNTQDSSASDAAAQDGHTPRRDTSSTLGLRKPGSAPH